MRSPSNIAWGIQVLIWPAIAACLIATAAILADDGLTTATLVEVRAYCLWYLTMAISGGTVLGLTRPLLKSASGVAATGFLTALPITSLILFAGPAPARLALKLANVVIMIAVAAIFGPLLAMYGASRAGRVPPSA